MSSQWTIFLTAGVCAAMLTGCGGSANGAVRSVPNDAEMSDSVVFDANTEAFAVDTETVDTFRTPADDAQRDTPRLITEPEALAAAFQHAGISGDDVQVRRSHLDREHGVDKYELTFTSGVIEYEYEIDAVTGVILESEQEPIHDKTGNPSVSSNSVENPGSSSAIYLTEAEVMSIALEHAGLTEADVSRLKVEFDRDDGRMEYEVEFHAGRTEYKYELDAQSGEILDYEIDND